MKKNVIWWTGITNPYHNEKYGGFKFFEYSKKSWEFWCKRNNCEFVAFTEPIEKDLKKYEGEFKNLKNYQERSNRQYRAVFNEGDSVYVNYINYLIFINFKYYNFKNLKNLKKFIYF